MIDDGTARGAREDGIRHVLLRRGRGEKKNVKKEKVLLIRSDYIIVRGHPYVFA